MSEKALVDPEVCTVCDKCLSVCKQEALSKDSDLIGVDLEKCNGCGECVRKCPVTAIELIPMAGLMERADFDMAL